MNPKIATCCLALALLAACTPDPEQQALDAVGRFYGGGVHYKKGSHLSTSATEPQGKYLEMTLANYTLGRDFADLRLPASNCAYLVYGSLAPADRAQYNYLKITLKDSASTRSYAFGLPELATVSTAATNLAAFMGSLQQRDYLAATAFFNPAALHEAAPDSVPTLLARAGAQLSPFTTYRLHGYTLLKDSAATTPLVRFYVETQGPNNDHHCLAVVNPRLSPTEKFMYGLALVQ